MTDSLNQTPGKRIAEEIWQRAILGGPGWSRDFVAAAIDAEIAALKAAPTQDMVERVARAISQVSDTDDPWQNYRDSAKAAIEAMGDGASDKSNCGCTAALSTETSPANLSRYSVVDFCSNCGSSHNPCKCIVSQDDTKRMHDLMNKRGELPVIATTEPICSGYSVMGEGPSNSMVESVGKRECAVSIPALGVDTSPANPSEISVKIAEEALVDYFKRQVREEFPNATLVPSDNHHRLRAQPIIQALHPYLRTTEPVSVDLEDAVRVLWNRQHSEGKGFGDYDAFKAKYPNDCKAHETGERNSAIACAEAWGLKWK